MSAPRLGALHIDALIVFPVHHGVVEKAGALFEFFGHTHEVELPPGRSVGTKETLQHFAELGPIASARGICVTCGT